MTKLRHPIPVNQSAAADKPATAGAIRHLTPAAAERPSLFNVEPASAPAAATPARIRPQVPVALSSHTVVHREGTREAPGRPAHPPRQVPVRGPVQVPPQTPVQMPPSPRWESASTPASRTRWPTRRRARPKPAGRPMPGSPSGQRRPAVVSPREFAIYSALTAVAIALVVWLMILVSTLGEGADRDKPSVTSPTDERGPTTRSPSGFIGERRCARVRLACPRPGSTDNRPRQ